ncbi:substrate-binding domain-containing protein [Roseomonas sp. E05]|uniref:LacI family DNA-binding transcriptional regulator n=1 Tax=Roseomonas sp. E05 TaxID=3046310 RepID=UPI0024B8B1A6|nr:substrate-binding domain-containing protein [Roseomonas sp. E05]MDJ0390540.1 substrate-binding domain-containing protein [Roseomonas sp. E05]
MSSPIGRRSGTAAAPTIRDVAEVAGVGLGTVSRVINGRPEVSPELRERVLAAIRSLGYAPDAAAQSLRSGQSRSFACVVRDLTVPVLASFVDGMQQELDKVGYGLFVASSYHDPKREAALLGSFVRRRVDGIVIATASERKPQVLRALRAVPVPVTLLDRTAPAGFDSVLVDHAAGSEQAVARLLELGHRRIGFISGEPTVRATRERLRGFEAAFARRGLAADPELLRLGSFAADFAQEAAMALLDGPEPPSAFFAAGTALLPGLLRALQLRGLRIPQDISVVAGADSELAAFHVPPISVVRWDHRALGVSAASFLLGRLAQPDMPPRSLMAPTAFLDRGSCAPPARAPGSTARAAR